MTGTMEDGKRVYCLYRVSTAKQVDHDEFNQADIPMQRIACNDFAARRGWEIIREEQENGVSGFKVSASNRDKIQLIKEHALERKFDILLVFMFDRIGRISSETPFIVEWFVQHGIRVWSVNEGEQRFDSHVDHLTNFIRFWQADGESQKTSVRVKEKRRQMAVDGLYGGGSVPYGYRLVPTGMKNKRKMAVYTYAVNDEEAAVVRLMFDKCVNEGLGRWALSTYLNSHGFKTRDGQNWYHTTVGRILQNVGLTGIVCSGGVQSEPKPELRIIDDDMFRQAQALINQRCRANNKIRTMPLNTKGMSLLSGNVFCGHCGARLTITTNGKVWAGTDNNGERTRRLRVRYVCYGKTRQRCRCDGQTGYTMHILDGIVEQIIHDIFKRINEKPENEVIAQCNDNRITEITTRLKNVRAEYASAAKEMDALQTEMVKVVMGQSQLPKDILTKALNDTKEKCETTKAMAEQLEQELDQKNNQLDVLKKKYTKLLDWSAIFDDADIAVKKMIAAYLISSVEVSRGYQLKVRLNMDVQQFDLGMDYSGCEDPAELDTKKDSLD
jgi:DNA invertase Pin-like site-specific DNA recombinase